MAYQEKDHYTIAFKVVDHAKFREFLKGVTAAFASSKQFHGAQITGCGQGDDMTRADLLAQYIDGRLSENERVYHSSEEVLLQAIDGEDKTYADF